MITELEAMLFRAKPISPSCESDIDLLRQVYIGEIGTKNQRNALVRILADVRPKEDVMRKLTRALGEAELYRGKYSAVAQPLIEAQETTQAPVEPATQANA